MLWDNVRKPSRTICDRMAVIDSQMSLQIPLVLVERVALWVGHYRMDPRAEQIRSVNL